METTLERSFAEVERAALQLGGMGNAVVANQLAVVRELAAFDGDLREDGHCSIGDWLRMNWGMGRSEAKRFARLAVVSEQLPQLMMLFGQGFLSLHRLELLSRAIDGERFTDAFWAEAERYWSDAQIAAVVRQLAEAPTASDDADHRSIRFRKTRRNTEIMSAEYPIDMMAVVRAAVDRDAINVQPAAESGLYPDVSEARADALYELCSNTIAADGDADRATVVVEATLENLTGQGFAEICDETISLTTLRRLACDARLQVASIDGLGRTVGIGRADRIVPHWLYRRLRKRDRGCRFPGCGKNRWVHAHHIQFWSDGGPTNLDNLILLCPIHHRYVHENGWTIEGNPERTPVQFISPSGCALWANSAQLEQQLWDEFVKGVDQYFTQDDSFLRTTLGLERDDGS